MGAYFLILCSCRVHPGFLLLMKDQSCVQLARHNDYQQSLNPVLQLVADGCGGNSRLVLAKLLSVSMCMGILSGGQSYDANPFLPLLGRMMQPQSPANLHMTSRVTRLTLATH